MVVAGLSVSASASSADSSAVVVANRGSGDVSVIDTTDLSVTNYDLPGDAEPMYVNHDPDNDVVWIGDRASSTVVALDDETFEVVATVDVADGVFHQWLDPARDQLWVVGTAASTVTIVDTKTAEATTTITIPAELIEAGGITHDVFVKGNNAFVSLVGLDGYGVVLRYSTRTFELTGQIETGGDPHLFVQGGRLYVASQEANSVSSYVPATLRKIGETSVPTAHGIFVTRNNNVVVTNIAGGGVDAIWQLNRSLDTTADPVSTDAAVAHNVTVTASGTIFATHSGPNNVVSVIDADTGETQLVTVGANPFGLASIR